MTNGKKTMRPSNTYIFVPVWVDGERWLEEKTTERERKEVKAKKEKKDKRRVVHELHAYAPSK
jgi:hypothetical protein